MDFEQAQEIALEPDLQVDLAYYQLNENDFIDSETNAYTPFIRDTIRLEFLDDDYIQDGLMYAELRFRHENSFPYTIQSNIRFLGGNGSDQFNVSYAIPPGTLAAPSVVDTVRVLEGSEISKMRRSLLMVMELEVIGAGKDIEGTLDFSSKGFFRFEF